MISGQLSMVATATGGRLQGADRGFSGISTDTRSLRPGELFFALRGASRDGAAFLAEAARLGAAAAVLAGREAHLPLAQIEVDDALFALGRLAGHWRQRFTLPVVGITGSNGKTTVKEMTAAILRVAFGEDAVLVTAGNFNNEIGLPLTVASLGSVHRAAVIEMGAARRGDIAYLADIGAPTVAVVNNATPAHLQGFGSLDEVAATKGEIYDALPAEGTAVLNRDDRYFDAWRRRAGSHRQLSFGLHPEADLRAGDIRVAEDIRFTLQAPEGEVAVRLPMAGRHNLRNALAAAAAALGVGVGLGQVAEGLALVRNVAGRMQRVPARLPLALYDDSYNANPASVRAAIDFLGSRDGERCLVLGDMAELGAESLALHREIGRCAHEAGIQRLYCTGEQSRSAAEAFGSGARWFARLDTLVASLEEELPPQATVLVKGSRSMGMERVVQALAATGVAGEG